MGTTVFQEVNPVLAAAVFAAEQPVRRIYRRCHFEVISESTRDDLVARGFQARRIHVIHCGIDRVRYRTDATVVKTPEPSLVYVGSHQALQGRRPRDPALVAVRRRFRRAR
jgi:hypothetical protein